MFNMINRCLEKCNCVKFSMPRSNSTKICEHSEMNCYLEAADLLKQNEISQSIQFGYPKSHCNCLPLCTSITYEPEVTPTNADFKKYFETIDKDYDKIYPGILMTQLTIYFKDTEFTSFERSEIYGLTDFIANCGGLFGKAFEILRIIYE